MSIPQDMKAELDRFEQTAEKIFEPFQKDLESKESPPIIYHYTNDVGLRGILETGQLWLTDIFNLNDPSELSHGFSPAVHILNKMAENGPPESKVFARDFMRFYQEGGIQSSAHYFTCSFSTDGNDLGQWRAYADNGRGYALGFDANILANGFARNDRDTLSANSTFHITYDDTKLEELHRQLIESMFSLISLPRGRELEGASINAYMMELSTLLSVYALRSALFFKHKAYENEKEFRFLQMCPTNVDIPEVKQRFRSYELVRFRQFDWKHLQAGVIKRIVVGPAADSTKATRFVKDCLTAFNIENVEIEGSKIPYRAI